MHPNQTDKRLISYHLGFFLFLLYGSEETLLFFFFGWLWGVQHNRVWASPLSKSAWRYFKCTSFFFFWFKFSNHQGSNPGCRFEWFVSLVPSEDKPESRLWPLLSWKELSGRGEGTVQQTQHIFRKSSIWNKKTQFCWLSTANRKQYLNIQDMKSPIKVKRLPIKSWSRFNRTITFFAASLISIHISRSDICQWLFNKWKKSHGWNGRILQSLNDL